MAPVENDLDLEDLADGVEHADRVEELIGDVDGLDDAMALVLDRLAVLEMEIDELWDQLHAER